MHINRKFAHILALPDVLEKLPFTFESSVTSEVVIACFDSFANSVKKPTIVVIDNASIHHSKVFNKKIGEWEEKNLFLLYLPPYSPELNKIEILWKHIKYYWLSFDAYKSFSSLRQAVTELSKIFFIHNR